jgi:hypothetical protein
MLQCNAVTAKALVLPRAFPAVKTSHLKNGSDLSKK